MSFLPLLESSLLRSTIPMLLLAAVHPGTRAADLEWPEITAETKPWSRWWWLGNIGRPEDFSSEMEKYAAVGLGGLEITPIYGVRGYESRFVPYLSADWMKQLGHVLEEGKRLDLGIDMATGTGWPFGGPWIGPDTAGRYLVHRVYPVGGSGRLEEPVVFEQEPVLRFAGPLRVVLSELRDPVSSNDNLQALALDQVRFPRRIPLVALIGFSSGRDPIDLTGRVDPDGRLDWEAPPASEGWTLHALFQGWHGKQVERAGPGGEGDVVDHFSGDALKSYLGHFDQAFAGRPLDGLRAFFNDSYEVDDADGEADFTPSFLEAFEMRRGYDLRWHLPALSGGGDGDEAARVLSDYRETISDLLLEEFTRTWGGWARAMGKIIRNQAHGSPGNLLDLYAASDIPEQEGSDVLSIKMASSAAHVTGKRLASAEAATWINEHFSGTLGEVKEAVDQFFLGGINHIVYHGTAFSPPDEPWPGFHFYASIELNPSNPIWRDFPVLNRYVARVQSFLQTGRPDEDVLLYYPIHDRWAQVGDGTLPHFHGRENEGMTQWREVSGRLHQAGLGFDFVSDRQLGGVTLADGLLRTEGGADYRAIVLPETRLMPLETLQRVLGLVAQGATAVVQGSLPVDVPGWSRLEERRAAFEALVGNLKQNGSIADGVEILPWGRGRLLIGDDPVAMLEAAGVRRETLVDVGFSMIRRRTEAGHDLFLVNRSVETLDGWFPLADAFHDAALYDPMSGMSGRGATRTGRDMKGEIFLQVPPGASIIIRTSDRAIEGPAFPYWRKGGEGVAIGGEWSIDFVAGGPDLPESVVLQEPGFWTERGWERAAVFSGTAVYRTGFVRPENPADGWMLNLPEVADSCRVRLNGREIAALIHPPWRVILTADELLESNDLEIEVTNLAANRIADLDRRSVLWKRFYNVNMPARFRENRGPDGLFTAAAWPVRPSGLAGPVTLTPMEALKSLEPMPTR
ncbi:MAG: glycosyl hydrolase [Opitutaceae bacterium]